MLKIGIFCASAGGNSLKIAEALNEAFETDDIINMEEDFDEVAQLLEYDVLFIGSSTWGQGDVHHSWVDPLFEITFEDIDLNGKTVAFFGAGDSQKHGEHFCSALGKLYKIFTNAGAKAVGFMPKEEYNYDFSLAEIDGKLCGLAIDEHNESQKTDVRIEQWIEQLNQELRL
ncbi:MAG: flavodoxin [Sulfurovaceae bacterium]|nr:flavodoxin [Sulfurovaceae bacterium]